MSNVVPFPTAGEETLEEERERVVLQCEGEELANLTAEQAAAIIWALEDAGLCGVYHLERVLS